MTAINIINQSNRAQEAPKLAPHPPEDKPSTSSPQNFPGEEYHSTGINVGSGLAVGE